MNDLEEYELDILIYCMNELIAKLNSKNGFEGITVSSKEEVMNRLHKLQYKLESKKLNL